MKSYDSRCADLAEVFLGDGYSKHPNYKALVDEMAQRIQDVIEDFMMEQESYGDKPDK